MNFRTNNMQNLFLFNILNLCKLISEVRHSYSKSLVVRLRHKPVEEPSQDASKHSVCFECFYTDAFI